MFSFDQVVNFLFVTKDGGFNWDMVSNLLTSISLVLITVSIIEVRKQRRESYKPLLALHDEALYLQKNPQGVPANLTKTLSLPREIFSTNAKFRLSNIGLAASVKTRISWIPEHKKLIADLASLNEIAKMVNIQNFDDYTHITYESLLPGFNYIFSVRQAIDIQQVSFVRNAETVECRIPDGAATFLCLYQTLKLGTSKKVDTISEQFEIPGLFRIEYEDISGNRYISNWRIEVDSYVSKNGWGENQMTIGQLNLRFVEGEPS